MRFTPCRTILAIAVITCLQISPALAKAAGQRPSPQEKCPVCGMFVSKFPDWLAIATFKDGTTRYFDGPKDLFTYYLNIGTYKPGATPAAVSAIRVKDYYTLRGIDGRTALYVIGSDVLGPMGKELVPFASEADARGFLRDHRGARLLRFTEITATLLKSLE